METCIKYAYQAGLSLELLMEWFKWSISVLRLALGMVEMEHSHTDILASIQVSCVRQVNVYVCM